MFKIKKIHLNAVWSFNLYNQDCAICRNPVCNSNEESVIGECGHAYHYNCIQNWLKHNKKVCPLCNQKWIFKTR